jgi:hypothetical protein
MGRSRARIFALSGLGFVLAGATGCVSYGAHLSATPLAPGEREVSLNADALVVDRGLGPQLLPNPELGYRWGIARDWDVGGRLNVGSVEGNARWRFARGRVRAALVPGFGFGFVPITNRDTGLFNAHLLTSVLAGVELGPGREVVFGARGALSYAFPLTAFRGEASGDELYLLPGVVAGLRFPISGGAWLFPELNLLRAYHTGRGEWLLPALQGGVALQF